MIQEKTEEEGHEAGKLERQRPAVMPDQGLSGICEAGGPGHCVPAGDEAAAGAGGVRAGGVSPVFPLRRQKGVFRHGGADQGGAPVRGVRLRGRCPPPRGAGHHGGISGILSGVLLHPQQSGRAEAAGLPDAVGG